MSDIRAIKRKIKSVQNIQQICRAMKMVASVRIRNADRKMKASEPYTTRYREVVGELMVQVREIHHPLMEEHTPVKNTWLIVITSDKGLCGVYNSNILQNALKYLKDHEGQNIRISVLGTKGYRFLTRRRYKIEEVIRDWEPSFELAYRLSRECQKSFLDRETDQVLCCYSRPVSTMVQEPKMLTLLPLTDLKAQCEQKKCLRIGPEPLPITFEPPPEMALGFIIPQYIDVIFYQILMEARVAEIGARLRAMTNATDNAEDLLGELNLKFFRARQEAITTEILEVSGGAEALKR